MFDGIRSARCLMLILVFLLFSAPLTVSSDEPIHRSIVLVLDLSYSMELREKPGVRRIQMLRTGLRELLDRRYEGTEWALTAFSDLDTIAVYHRFTTESRDLLPIVDRLPTGRLSPVGTAVAAALEYLERDAGGEKKAVVLVSDGISTEDLTLDFSLPLKLRNGEVPLFILGFDHRRNPPVRAVLSSIARSTGGEYFTFNEVPQLSEKLLSQPVEETGSAAFPPPVRKSGEVEPRSLRVLPVVYQPPLSDTGGVARSSSRRYLWSLILGLVCLAAYGGYRRWVQVRKGNHGNTILPPASLRLTVERPDGETEEFGLSDSPVLVGNTPKCTVKLEAKDRRKKLEFSYSWDDGGAVFRSAKPFILNGVAVREKNLKTGDKLVFGGHRITYNGLWREETPLPVVRDFSLFPLALGVFFMVLFGLLSLLRSVSPSSVNPRAAVEDRDAGDQRKEIDDAGVSDESEKAEEEEANGSAVFTERHETEKEDYRKPGVEAVEHISMSEGAETARPWREIGPVIRVPVTVFGPEERDYPEVDILFLHAHPDDESLDFGGFIAKAVTAGKRVAVVLFTDGESGRDQYPDRESDASHPGHYLSGGELAKTRTAEASSALSVLGCPTYIRLGLANYPYNTSRDAIPVSEVLSRWGGEGLNRIIEEIFLKCRPELVISSDFHAEAHEHFEHKAVGGIVRDVILTLRDLGEEFIKGYLVSVDPFQGNIYEDMELLDLMEINPDTGLTYREMQQAALMEHRTQEDASLIGVELLPNYRWERYLPVFAPPALSLEIVTTQVDF